MSLTVQPTSATFGATVTGVDLSRLNQSTWSEIAALFLEYALLIFPEQRLTADAQIAFASRFGDIERLGVDRDRKIAAISNQRPDGTLLDADEHGAKILLGNEGWHADSTYMPLAAKGAVMSAHVVPSAGGQTEWADMAAACEALDDSIKERIEHLSAYHSLFYSQRKIGHAVAVGAGYGFHDEENAPLRPLVKVHPETGRHSLLIGRHAFGIPGMSPESSEQLLEDLLSFACRPPRVYEHNWNVGDAVLWDNRCLLHRARPFDRREPRVMMHTRIAGDPASELAANLG